jgi:signal transduction histidine kinase
VETNGVISSIVCILRDVSEHHQLEKELRLSLEHEKELSELKSRFVSIASHEFRTPLAAILSSTESVIAYRDRLTDVQIDHKLTTITQQVKHLTNIIEDVLNLGRIQAGRIDFRPVDLDLNVLCQDVLRELQANRDNMPRIQYNCNFSHVMMYLDETLIRQAFTNLVSNAIKYSAPDKAIIINLEKTDNLLVLRVQDQGIGIPDADIKHLFEPFHRATNVGTIPGTGLGLSITQEAVEMHGGTISVDSKISVGTTITVNIPLRNRGGARHDENSGNRR